MFMKFNNDTVLLNRRTMRKEMCVSSYELFNRHLLHADVNWLFFYKGDKHQIKKMDKYKDAPVT